MEDIKKQKSYQLFLLLILLCVVLSVSAIFFIPKLVKTVHTEELSSGRARFEPTIVVAVGDIVCDPADTAYGDMTRCHMARTAQLAADQKPDAVLALGDLQYEDGKLEKFRTAYETSWGALKNKTYPAPGNHEYVTSAAAGYYDYFAERAGDKSKGYYSFDLNGWHFIALNSNCSAIGGCGVDSPQIAWLKNDLANSPAQCTIAYWHHPRFTSGQYADKADQTLDRTTQFWEELLAKRTDIVLNGHDHIYERFAPQSSVATADPAGPRQFTVGTGGKVLYSLRPQKAANSEFAQDKLFGVLRLELFRRAYRWQFIAEDGSVLDKGRADCI